MFGRISGMRIDHASYIAAAERVIQWGHEGQSDIVCLEGVHMTVISVFRAINVTLYQPFAMRKVILALPA